MGPGEAASDALSHTGRGKERHRNGDGERRREYGALASPIQRVLALCG